MKIYKNIWKNCLLFWAITISLVRLLVEGFMIGHN